MPPANTLEGTEKVQRQHQPRDWRDAWLPPLLRATGCGCAQTSLSPSVSPGQFPLAGVSPLHTPNKEEAALLTAMLTTTLTSVRPCWGRGRQDSAPCPLPSPGNAPGTLLCPTDLGLPLALSQASVH